MDFASLPQIVIGGALFLSSGYAVSLAIFGKDELDLAETAAISLAFSIMIPATVLLIATMLFKTRLDAFAMIAVFGLITAAGYGFWHKYRRRGTRS